MAESAVKWTTEQRAGIETVGMNLLVSAAAGSGKTAVLAARCAHLVCDARPPCDVDQLLVVTFTEAAAAEMKGRIEAALRRRLERSPEDARLQRQTAQIDRAQVGTLHAFCARLLRQHFHLVGLDPDFTILDGDEATLLRAEVVREQIADRYETDEAGEYQKFVDVYGDGRDEGLAEDVVRTHELLCSVVEPEEWLAEARRRIEEGATAAPGRLRETTLGKEFVGIIWRRLAALRERCTEAMDVLGEMTGFEKYLACLGELAGELDAWTKAFGKGDFDALARRVVDFETPRKPSVRNDVAGKGAAEAAFEAVREGMGEEGPLWGLARFSETEWRAGLESMLPFARIFLGLVREFRERYEAAKQRARRVDFADLERLALRVLCADDGGPSAVATAMHRQISQVLVDEYQDINGVQEGIIRLISRECFKKEPRRAATELRHLNPLRSAEGGEMEGNLFCVGDVKQSIYGFRLAEPGRLLERYGRMKSGERGEERVIDLLANFRSRGPLLGAINALFERLMTVEAADIEYDESQKLTAAALYPAAAEGVAAFAGAPVEIHLLPCDVEVHAEGDEEAGAPELDRTEREASFIAARIHALLGHDGSPRMNVADKGEDGQTVLRPIEYRDIVILLRSMVYKADQVAEVLRRHGIPVHRESGSGYFDTTEVRDVMSLLRVLDNFQQDVPLAAVMRSPIAGFKETEDKLARIRLSCRGAEPPMPFHEAVTRYAAEQTDELAEELRAFLEQLGRWRQMSRMRPLAEVLWQIFDETGYLAFCSGLENGEQRVANVMYLYERARQFGQFSRQGLYRFLKFLEALEAEADLGLPTVLAAGENVVRIMSVHKAKGLEFPVVFLADMGKRFNLSAASGKLMVDRARYLGLVAVDDSRQVRYPSLASVLVAERLRQQVLAEELRVLYVAMTRAKENLILVGTCDGRMPEKWRTLWGSHVGPLPAEVVLGATSMLNWIGTATAGLPDLFALTMHTSEDVQDWTVEAEGKAKLTPRQAALAALKLLVPEPEPSAEAEEIIRRVTYRYPYEQFSALRAAVAVSELAKPAGAEAVTGEALALPKAVRWDVTLVATDRGTATHLVLEHLDFSQPCRGEDLAAQIDWMVHRSLMTKEQAAAVDLAAIEWFFTTDLGRRVRHAAPEDVMREVPFSLARAAEGTAPAPADRMMVRGRIDLLVREGSSYLVVDYKTDRVAAEELEVRRADYQTQMAIYREAIEAITGAQACEVRLVFLAARVMY